VQKKGASNAHPLLLSLTLAIAAAYLVVASVAFPLVALAPNALGMGMGMLVVSRGAAMFPRRRPPTAAIAAATAPVSESGRERDAA
jgi:hypothetical protein